MIKIQKFLLFIIVCTGTNVLTIESFALVGDQAAMWTIDSIDTGQGVSLPIGSFGVQPNDSAHVGMHATAASTQLPLTSIHFVGADALGRHADDSVSTLRWNRFPYDTTVQIYHTPCVDGAHEYIASQPALPSLLPVNPNPFSQFTNIHFTLSSSAHITLRITNILGEIVKTICSDVRIAGTYVVPWDASGLPAGMYYCELNGAWGTLMQRMVKY